ncbi:hypothetical protein LSH36_219g02029 [Paralvinella palmiformis]|uniref:Glycosyltransferase 61 catalytic domain-containing protein n=1 Tax=Paralvinella palmiformis TaxID=53620 RepID=A0AAD9N4A7_9ANNE|nr:hypothetical protein LSH36_219g02029 [Paralvinella palmiformis]
MCLVLAVIVFVVYCELYCGSKLDLMYDFLGLHHDIADDRSQLASDYGVRNVPLFGTFSKSQDKDESQPASFAMIRGALKSTNVSHHFSDDLIVSGGVRNSSDKDDTDVGNSGRIFHSSACVTSANVMEMRDVLMYRPKPYSAFWVDVDAPLLYRLKVYNLAIGILRAKIRRERGYRIWSDPAPSPVVIWASRDDFFEQLSNFTHIQTVALSWIRSECSDRNLLIMSYPEWIASEPLCTWIRTPGHTKARWDAVYNRTCVTELDAALRERPLEPLYLHAKPINPNHYWPNKGLSYPWHFYSDPPRHVLYLHVAEDAIVTSVGDIFSGSVKIVPYSCSHDLTPSKPEGYSQALIFSEVFIMSGHWGSGHFHKSIELIPRIAPYLDFLIKHPDIMIQVSETGGRTANTLIIFGIRKERLVSGSLRAKIAYLPQATPCGFGQVQELQVLSKLYRDHIRSYKNVKSRNIVVIHRSGLRRLTDASHIEMSIEKLAAEYGLQFRLYHDQQLPSFEDTMIMFNEAVLVVAPHGAGSSNILFCEPGTFFVEFVCNQPHVNMCYQHVAHVLGLRYHGIPSEEGCEDHIKVNPKLIEFVVRTKLEQWKHLQAVRQS